MYVGGNVVGSDRILFKVDIAYLYGGSTNVFLLQALSYSCQFLACEFIVCRIISY